MDPEVPHALRLQAILASGVCIVYNRQSEFLLNDFQSALVSLATAHNAQNMFSPFVLYFIQRSLTAATQVDHTANLDVALARYVYFFEDCYRTTDSDSFIQLCRPRDIDMDAEDLTLVAAERAFALPTAAGVTPFVVRGALEDLVQMPSVPEATDGRSAPSPAARDQQQQDELVMM